MVIGQTPFLSYFVIVSRFVITLFAVFNDFSTFSQTFVITSGTVNCNKIDRMDKIDVNIIGEHKNALLHCKTASMIPECNSLIRI